MGHGPHLCGRDHRVLFTSCRAAAAAVGWRLAGPGGLCDMDSSAQGEPAAHGGRERRLALPSPGSAQPTVSADLVLGFHSMSAAQGGAASAEGVGREIHTAPGPAGLLLQDDDRQAVITLAPGQLQPRDGEGLDQLDQLPPAGSAAREQASRCFSSVGDAHERTQLEGSRSIPDATTDFDDELDEHGDLLEMDFSCIESMPSGKPVEDQSAPAGLTTSAEGDDVSTRPRERDDLHAASPAGGPTVADASPQTPPSQHHAEGHRSTVVRGALKDVTWRGVIAAAVEGLAGLVRYDCDLHAALVVCAVACCLISIVVSDEWESKRPHTQVDANSIGSVLPAFENYGLLSGMIGYFIHQFTAGCQSELKPHIISLSWEVSCR